MAGKIAALPVAVAGRNLGQHNSRMFDMTSDEDCRAYSELRTKNNDRGSGVVIERIKELTQIDVDVEGSGKDRIETRQERYKLFVEWWEKSPTPDKGDADAAPKEFSVESPVARA